MKTVEIHMYFHNKSKVKNIFENNKLENILIHALK